MDQDTTFAGPTFAGLLDQTGWPNAEVARRLDVATSSVRDWRTGRRQPSPAIQEWIERVASAIESTGQPPQPPGPGRPRTRKVQS